MPGLGVVRGRIGVVAVVFVVLVACEVGVLLLLLRVRLVARFAEELGFRGVPV